MRAREGYQTPAEAGGRVAPAGGPFGGRGRAVTLLAVCAALPGFARAELVELPSGQETEYHDVIQDTLDNGLTFRFRFVAPWISSEGLDFEAVFTDMEFLCNSVAQPRVSSIGPQPARLVITLMSEPTEFGLANPDVTQFFESFSLSDGVCIWEVF